MDFHIKDVLHQYLRKSKLNSGVYKKKIEHCWQQTMSPSIVRHTKSLKFEKGKLIIHVDSSPLRQQLFENREKIKKMINEQLGETIVHLVLIH